MTQITSFDIDNIKELFKNKGYKLTAQRRAIVDVILKKEGTHLTVEELYDCVKKQFPEIGLATVYRTIQLLYEIGLINKVNLDDGCSRYELIKGNENHRHHHLICKHCGKVTEVEEDLLEELEEGIRDKYHFQIIDHSVKFYGLCYDCINKK